MKMKKFNVTVDGKKYDVDVDEIEEGKFKIKLDNKSYNVSAQEEITEEQKKTKSNVSTLSGEKTISSPISGTIGKINVKEGTSVKSGAVLLTLIAMKMENEIKATSDGKVKEIKVKIGETVDVGDVLIELA